MLTIEKADEIYLYPGATDMRYGIQGLFVLAGNPEENTVHLFCSADRKTIKMLFAEEGSICLLAKRLTYGRFQWPEKGEASQIDYGQLVSVLDGLSVVKKIENGGRIPRKMF